MSLSDSFKARYPELAKYADEWIPILEPELTCFYGVAWDNASNCDKNIILALLAHLIWFSTQNGSDGSSVRSLNSATVGNVSTSFGALTSGTGDLYDFFTLSRYGQLFLMLTRKNQGARWV